MTEENFLEVCAVQSRYSSLLMLHCRPKTSLFRVLTASMALAWVSSYKLATEQFCTFARHSVLASDLMYLNASGLIAKLSSAETKRLTTLQRELFRFVGIIAGMATIVATIIVILWAAWCVDHSLHCRLCLFLAVLVRLRRTFPSYINVSNLLIDVVSVMGMLLLSLPVQSTHCSFF